MKEPGVAPTGLTRQVMRATTPVDDFPRHVQAMRTIASLLPLLPPQEALEAVWHLECSAAFMLANLPDRRAGEALPRVVVPDGPDVRQDRAVAA